MNKIYGLSLRIHGLFMLNSKGYCRDTFILDIEEVTFLQLANMCVEMCYLNKCQNFF